MQSLTKKVMLMAWLDRCCFLLCVAMLLLPLSLRAETVTVYAAASLNNALREVAAQWQKARPDDEVKASFAASSTLAKQIEAGAPASIYASADRRWMDYLQARGMIDAKSRRDLLGNELVLIAPQSQPQTLVMKKSQAAPVFNGRLCMGEPGSVPAGVYGKQALQALGWWQALQARVVATEDVRTALAFVERAECAMGVVYATDARISERVMIAGRFPADSHAPVVYPFALLPRASATARNFFSYLQSSEAGAVFQRYGFVLLKP